MNVLIHVKDGNTEISGKVLYFSEEFLELSE